MAADLESQNWYYARDRHKVGPVSLVQLRALAAAGQLRPADMVLRQGASRWTQALALDGLFPPAPSAVEWTEELPAKRAVVAPAPLAVWAPEAPTQATMIPLTCEPGQETVGGTRSASGRVDGSPGLPTIPGYIVRAELGRGGMGVVYQAEHVKLKRIVALKMVLGGAVASSRELERFRAEAEAVARLQHPNIVQVYEVGERDGLPFFSLEYCAGGSLAQRLDGTPLPHREAADLVDTLARAMHAAHERNIIHRDLKPANILFDADGHAKVTDFGLAKKLDETAVLTQSGAVMGTPSYMAPEQALGNNKELGPAADVYALGSILYELLTGRPPFKGASAMDTIVQVAMDEPVAPSRLQPKVPADLETVCMKCLEKAPARRYPSALALADDLKRFCAGEPIQARPVGLLERWWKWSRRRPATAALLAVSALALFVMLAGATYFNLELRQKAVDALALKEKAEQQRERAEEQGAEARKQEREAQRQKEKADEQSRIALEREAEARVQLDQSRRSLLTAQVWRVAGLLERDPLQALALLKDDKACPPELHDFAWGYYHARCRKWKPVSLTGHRGSCVHHVAVSPDGKTLASAGNDGAIKLWNLPTRKEQATLSGHKGGVNTVAFSPDGALLASGGADRMVKLWDAVTGKEIATLKGHRSAVQSLAFSPDSKRIVSGSGNEYPKWDNKNTRFRDGELRLWDVAARKQERVLIPKQDTAVLVVAFARDGKTVAAGVSHGSYVRLIDANTGKDLVDRFSAGAGWVQAIAFSPDGQTLAWGTAQHLVYLRDLAQRKTRRTLRGHQQEIWGVAWSPDGQTLASSDQSGRVKLWNPETGQERLTLRDARGRIREIAFSTDGKTLVVGHCGAPKMTLWDLAPRPDWAAFKGPAGFRAVALSGEAGVVAGAGKEANTVQLWNLRSPKDKGQVLQLGGHGVCLAFSSSRSVFAVGVKAKTKGWCQLWDSSGKLLEKLKGGGRPITAVAFTPDGNLITGDEAGKVRLWDAARRQEVVFPGGHAGAVLALAVSADGKTLASAGGPQIKLWNLSERRERGVLEGHRAAVTGLGFLNKGQTLASTGLDRSVKLWDVAARTLRTSLPNQPDAILSLAVSPDGQTLALGCQDRTVKLWDVASGQLRAVLSGHTREVNAVAFSPDGQFLASASAAHSSAWVKGGEIKVWKSSR